MEISLITNNPKETRIIAHLFLRALLKGYCFDLKRKKALIISLEGNLGSGKTEFMKGVGECLKIKKDIFSPTFLIMKRFPLKNKSKFFENLWHLDCYRIKNIKEIKTLGFKDIVNDKKNLIFVEWGNKIKTLFPKNYWRIKFKIIDRNKRLLIFKIPLKITKTCLKN